MLSLLLADLVKDIVFSSIYDCFKYLVKNINKDLSDSIDEKLLKNICDVTDTTVEKFFKKYGNMYGEIQNSFLAWRCNYELIIKSFYYGSKIDLVKEMKRDGDGIITVSEEAINWFVKELYEEARKYDRLDERLEEKEFQKKMLESIKLSNNNFHDFVEKGILPLINSEYVIGRDDVINDIDELLSERCNVIDNIDDLPSERCNIINLYGVPGIGKKSICRKYITKFRENYSILWISYNMNLDKSIRNVFYEDSENMKISDIIYNLNTYASSNKLLVVISDFSNFEDTSLDLLSKIAAPIIITSCVEFDSDIIKDYKIKKMSVNESYEIFKKYYKNNITKTEKEYVLNIIEKCEQHTLSIKLFAKSAKSNKISLDKLLCSLQAKQIEFKDIGGKAIEHNNVFKVIKSHFEDLFNWAVFDENHIDLLTQLSILPAQGIKMDILHDMNFNEKIIFKLIENGLVEERDNNIIMNDIIQNVVREKLKPDYQKCIHIIEYLTSKDIPLLYYYGISILEYIDEYNDDIFNLYNQVVKSLVGNGLYEKAKDYIEMIEERFSDDIKKRNNDIINTNKSIVYFNLPNYEEAYKYIKLAYPNFINIFRSNKENDLVILNAAIAVFNQYGDDEKAKKSYKKALQILKKLKKVSPSLVFALYNNIAKYFINAKNYEKALEFHLQAKEPLENYMINDYDDMILWLIGYSIIILEMKKEDYLEAKEALDDAIAISNEFGIERYFPAIYHELGYYWIKEKEYDKSIMAVRNSLKFGRKYNSNNLEKGKNYYYLGQAYVFLNQLIDAKTNYEKARELFKISGLPANHSIIEKVNNELNYINQLNFLKLNENKLIMNMDINDVIHEIKKMKKK